MKILFATLMLPQPHADHASSFTVFKVIEHLSKRHDVSLVSFVVSEEERRAARFVAQYCRVDVLVQDGSRAPILWLALHLFHRLGDLFVCVDGAACDLYQIISLVAILGNIWLIAILGNTWVDCKGLLQPTLELPRETESRLPRDYRYIRRNPVP